MFCNRVSDESGTAIGCVNGVKPIVRHAEPIRGAVMAFQIKIIILFVARYFLINGLVAITWSVPDILRM